MKDAKLLSSVDVVKPEISPETFFSEYVAKRKPVVIDGLLSDSSFKAENWVGFQYHASSSGYNTGNFYNLHS